MARELEQVKLKLGHIVEKFARIAIAIVFGAALLLLLVSVLAQLPPIQNMICKRALAELNSAINGKADLDRIYIVFPNRIVIKNLSIVSHCPDSLLCDSIIQAMNISDTLVSCRKISLALSTRDIFRGRLGINRLELDNGVFNLTSEELKTTNLERIFKLEKKAKKDKSKSGLELKLSKLKLNRFRFTLKNPYKPQIIGDSLINWADLRLSGINVDIKRIKLKDEVLTALIQKIRFKEASGFECRKLSAKLSVDPELACMEDLLISDAFSKLKMDYFKLIYNSAHALASFTDSVSIDTRFNNTEFCMKTLRNFSPNLPLCKGKYILNGTAQGPIKHMKAHGMSIQSCDGNVDMHFSYRINGLPKVKETIFEIKLDNTCITSEGLVDILSNFSDSQGLPTIGKITPGQVYTANLFMTGPLDNFNAGGTIESEIGNVDADIYVKDLLSAPKYGISGSIATNGLDLEKFTGSSTLGICNSKAYFKTEIVKHSQNNLQINIDSILVSQLDIGDYSYSDLMAAGLYNGNNFDGRIISRDPNLKFLCQGVFALKPLESDIYHESIYEYKVYLSVAYANLANLHLMNRDSLAQVSFTTNAEISGLPGRFLSGDVKIRDAIYINEHGEYPLGKININSYHFDDQYTASIQSNFVRGGYRGNANIREFIQGLLVKTLYTDIPNIPFLQNTVKTTKRDSLSAKKMNGSITLDFDDTHNLFATVYPKVKMEKGARMTAEIKEDGSYTASFNGKGLSWGNTVLYYPLIRFNNKDSKTNLSIITEEIRTPLIKMERAGMYLSADNNRINASFRFNSDSLNNNNANINAIAEFNPDYTSISIDESSYITLKGARWNIGKSSMTLTDELTRLNSFSMFNSQQSITAGGFWAKKSDSSQNKDSLDIEMNQFDLNILNSFTANDMDIQGLVSGKARYSNLKKEIEMMVDIHADSLSIYRYPVGTLDVGSKYLADKGTYALSLVNYLEGNAKIKVGGIYDPKLDRLKMNASLNELSTSLIEPFISSLFSDVKGNISGELLMEGPLKNLKLTSKDIRIDKFNGLFNFTNARYTINGPIKINEKEIIADNLEITDEAGGNGILSGGASYNLFRNVQLNTKLRLRNILGLNTRMSHNSQYYGRIFADADIDITGPLNDLNLNLNVTPSSKSSLHIPLASSTNAVSSNLLSFKKEEFDDSYDELFFNYAKEIKEKTKSNLNVNLTANANTFADVFIEINKEKGDILHANGDGIININVNPSKNEFVLLGNYTINEGDYKFVFDNMALASRTFKLKQGGKLTFNGGVNDINLDLEAEYNTKAAINTLISDTTGIASRRPVNCGIVIKGSLNNPTIKVSIDIPDLDPTTKVKVESALNTEGKVQKQFAALLISGAFVPDEISGITNNSTILYSNASEIVSNQLNGILQQLGIPVDLGLNYQQDQKGTNVFDFAVSTALFNNRILINGNIGNTNNSADGRNVIGNIDVDVKLDDKGKIRLSFFSHAADRYSNYLDNKQRTGIGFSYQKEFNNRHDFFTKRTKEQKEQAKLIRLREKERRKQIKARMKEARKNGRSE